MVEQALRDHAAAEPIARPTTVPGWSSATNTRSSGSLLSPISWSATPVALRFSVGLLERLGKQHLCRAADYAAQLEEDPNFASLSAARKLVSRERWRSR